MRIRPTIEWRLVLLAVLAATPGTAVGLYLLWQQPMAAEFKLLATTAILALCGFAIRVMKRNVLSSLRKVSGLLSAIREGDYSMRASAVQPNDALGEVLLEINAFGDSLQQQRFGSVESAVLLGKVLEEIDIAVLGFDRAMRLRLFNRRARTMLGESDEKLEGRTAKSLEVDAWLEGASPRIVDVTINGSEGRWELRRGSYHEGGEKCTLLFLSDLTPALREEERQAWQRLLQVLRHEVNNSLAPIQSLSATLQDLVGREQGKWSAELAEGLEVISNRSKSLSHFLSAYTRLAALPPPVKSKFRVEQVVRSVVALEPRLEVRVLSGPEVELLADQAQLEQLLINLIRNAVEAATETSGEVEMSWAIHHGAPAMLEIRVADGGLGIANSENLFVPFYTTKSGGSGIGLVLSRQIAEAHGGTLTVENRSNEQGCLAKLRLPIGPT